MTLAQRVRHILAGLLMLLGSALLLLNPEDGYPLVLLVLTVTLLAAGLRYLIYYFRMARHMVGGKDILFRGLIVFDAGVFALTLSDVPGLYVMVYLLFIHGFAGVVNILRAVEARGMQAGSWRLSLATGIANLLVLAACVLFAYSEEKLVLIYAIGLAYSALLRIASAFRRSAIVYIP